VSAAEDELLEISCLQFQEDPAPQMCSEVHVLEPFHAHQHDGQLKKYMDPPTLVRRSAY
jgi:hypothetical protein